MEDKTLPEYRETQVVEVGGVNKRIQVLREAYLNGALAVDSERLARKMIDLERSIDHIYQNEKKKQSNRAHTKRDI